MMIKNLNREISYLNLLVKKQKLFLEKQWQNLHQTEELLKTRDLLLELDWQGAFNIKEQFNSVKNISLIPPSYNILRNRLEKRGTESEESITMRLSAAKEEISKYPFYDYLVLNDDFENALSDLKNIILKKTSKKEFKTRVSENLLKNQLD